MEYWVCEFEIQHGNSRNIQDEHDNEFLSISDRCTVLYATNEYLVVFKCIGYLAYRIPAAQYNI